MEDRKISATKEKIIDVATDLFSQKGFSQTSLREIAKKVGIKACSVYNHFDSKEAILIYILNIYQEAVRTGGYSHPLEALLSEPVLSATSIMNHMFFQFEEEHDVKYRKILKIIMNERVSNSYIRYYFQNHFVEENFQYIKMVLDFLIENKKIQYCETAKVSGVLVSILLAYSTLSVVDIDSLSIDATDTKMFDLLEHVLNSMLEGRM